MIIGNTIYRRSKIEIEHAIRPTLNAIRATVEEKLQWKNVPLPVSKNIAWSVVREPVNTVLKVIFLAIASYVIYLLVRGTFAGIEVDNDTQFTEVFSSNEDTRLNTGLNLTNGDQAGQFMADGAVIGFVGFKLIVETPYNKFAGKTNNDCYKPDMIKFVKSIHRLRQKIQDEEGSVNTTLKKLIRRIEEINALYKHLEKDLAHYGVEPFCKLDELISEEQDESTPQESDIEMGQISRDTES